MLNLSFSALEFSRNRNFNFHGVTSKHYSGEVKKYLYYFVVTTV